MAIFNRDSNNDDIDYFFQLPDFANSSDNHNPLVKCDDKHDNNRKVIYYSNYHAARALSKTADCEDLGNNIDQDWYMVVSKDGDSTELLIHREEQITNKYGSVERAYK